MENLSKQEKMLLAVQHVLAMFGATVLVPTLTGLNPTIAILSAGIGTLLFHFVTKKIVPAFLGSSFAFIGAIAILLESQGMAYVKGGIISAGFVYIIVAGLIYVFGAEKIKSILPPVVTGPIIMVIGLRLSPVALGMIGYADNKFDTVSLVIALSVVATMIVTSVFAKGFFKLVPILISIIVGYIVAILFKAVDYSTIIDAPLFGFAKGTMEEILTLPKFNLSSVMAIAPIAFVVFIEHIGDITTNGAVCGKDFFKNPGIHRTMFGDGIATLAAGILGGPPNTTYSENTGVLAVTKNYDPFILRLAAVFAIALSLIGKVGGFIQSIPVPVMGGVSIILFGMIASIGVRTLVEEKLDFSHSRNLLIVSIILVFGIAVNEVHIFGNVSISGLALAALFGAVLNYILPKEI